MRVTIITAQQACLPSLPKDKLGIAQSTWHFKLRGERLERALQSKKEKKFKITVKYLCPWKTAPHKPPAAPVLESPWERKNLTSRNGTEGAAVGLCTIPGFLLLSLAWTPERGRDQGIPLWADRLWMCWGYVHPHWPLLLHPFPLLMGLFPAIGFFLLCPLGWTICLPWGCTGDTPCGPDSQVESQGTASLIAKDKKLIFAGSGSPFSMVNHLRELQSTLI